MSEMLFEAERVFQAVSAHQCEGHRVAEAHALVCVLGKEVKGDAFVRLIRAQDAKRL
jgi:hypothetical protein